MDDQIRFRPDPRQERFIAGAGRQAEIGLDLLDPLALEPFPFRRNRNGALSFYFDAFSSREPVSTSKWIPVRVKKTRQNKKIEPRSDSVGTEKALGRADQADPVLFPLGGRRRQ